MMEWQEISTARKDGTVVLLTNGTLFAQGHYSYRIEPKLMLRGYIGGEITDAFTDKVPNPDAGKKIEWWTLFGSSSFSNDDEAWDYDGPMSFEPTHWAPRLDRPDAPQMSEFVLTEWGGKPAEYIDYPCKNCGAPEGAAILINDLSADLEAVAVAAKPFLGVSPLAFRRPAGMDITLYEQRCGTALVEALARPGVKAVLEEGDK